MNQPIISIIVPVYNVEKYLARCLYSLVDIKVPYEIIIVNDGTKDDSLSIAKDFQKRFPDKEIKIISQPNQGLSVARNIGLSYSKGKYVSFIDSDDFIDPLNYSMLIKNTIENDLDIGIGEFILWKDSQDLELRQTEEKYINKGITEGVELINNSRPNIWNNVYRKRFLDRHNIKFIPKLLFEDEVFYTHTMLLAEKVKNFTIPFYFYYQRQGSTMTLNDYQRYPYYYLISNELFSLINIVKKQAAIDIICRKSWAFLRMALLFSYKYDLNEFYEKRKQYRSILDFVSKNSSLNENERAMIKDLMISKEITKFKQVDNVIHYSSLSEDK